MGKQTFCKCTGTDKSHTHPRTAKTQETGDADPTQIDATP